MHKTEIAPLINRLEAVIHPGSSLCIAYIEPPDVAYVEPVIQYRNQGFKIGNHYHSI